MILIPVYREIELVKFDGDTIQWCCPEWVHEALASGLLWVENDRLYRKNWCNENCMLTSIENGGYVARTDGFIFLMDAETENRLAEKQMFLILAIEKSLDVEFTGDTRQEASDFIDKYKESYNRFLRDE